MFNVDQKEAFIEFTLSKSTLPSVQTQRNKLINFFNRLAPIEQEFGKDFAMCNYEEIKVILSLVCRRSVKYQRTTISQLRKYLEWAIIANKSLDTENRLIGIVPRDIDISIPYKMSMLKDEEQLSEYLDMILKPMNEDNIDNFYRVLFHLVFNGFTIKDAIEIKNDDFDFERRVITFENREVHISETCSNLVAYLSEMDAYLSLMFHNGERVRKIKDTGHILERTVAHRDNIIGSVVPNISTIFAELKEALHYPISITLKDLLNSGIFYRMYVNEKKTGNIDIVEYIEQNKELAQNPDSLSNDGIDEYLGWKKAFELI